jgi:hypothetical protein
MKRLISRASWAFVVAIAATGLTHVACSDDDTAVKEDAGLTDSSPTPGDGSVTPDGGDAAPSDCFTNPQTHFEIINACTTATKITKNPVLPALLPDGGLPPLL